MYEQHHTSLHAMQQTADSAPVNHRNSDHQKSVASMRYGAAFYGMEEVVNGGLRSTFDDLVAHGWPEGRKRAQQLQGEINLPRPKSRKRRRRFADTGDTIDMDRVRNGQLDRAWQRTSRQIKNSPAHVLIAVNIGVSARQDSDELFWRGAAALTLVDHLTGAGYNVRVILAGQGWLTDRDKTPYLETCTIKSALARVDYGTLVTAVCHPATVRGYMYAARLRGSRTKINQGLGIPDRSPLPTTLAYSNEQMIEIPGSVASKHSAEQTVNTAINTLQHEDAA